MIKVASPPPDTAGKLPESAERSPIVQSANWKEGMLLQKKLHILNRSERNLVHRITIDQKVLFRRFQMKLHRSKLAFAEMMGEKEKVMDLRGLHLHGLNTNCGQSEGDYAFLAKLEYRPCIADGPCSIRRRSKRSQRSDTTKDLDVIQQVQKVQPPPVVRSMSASGRYSSSKGDNYTPVSGRRLAPPSSLPIRPATAAGTQVDKEYFVLPDVDGESADDKIHTFVAKLGRKDKNEGVKESRPRDKTPRGKQPHVSFAHISSDTTGGFPGSTGSSRRGSTSTSEGKSSKRSPAKKGSMFEEVKKLNVLELFLSEAKSVDYVPKVKEFCESMKTYENSCTEFDYYPQKMQAEVEQMKKDDALSVPGTPDTENYKFIGNTRVKSLTMPLVSFNFEEEGSLVEESVVKAGEDGESVE